MSFDSNPMDDQPADKEEYERWEKERAAQPRKKKRTPFVSITGVKLSRDSNDTFVLLEIGGLWVEVIREPILAQYDHIVNVSGIQKAAYAAHWQQAEDDLAASGGIVDAP